MILKNRYVFAILMSVILAGGTFFFIHGVNKYEVFQKNEASIAQAQCGGMEKDIQERCSDLADLQDSKENNSDFLKRFEFWSRKIDEVGTEQAYEEFRNVYASRHFQEQHDTAHIMGELLYEKKGIEAVVICDASFAFGCYHSFFGKAIEKGGIKTIPDLDAACFKKYGTWGSGCQHGIGHGILEFMGHDKLVSALNACTLADQPEEFFGCTSGVFMEYNFPTIITAETIQSGLRELNADNLHGPCNASVPERFRKSCYFEISLLWNQVFNRDFKKLGELCGDIANTEYREACYLGIGKVVVPSSNYNLATTIHNCQKIPDNNGKTLCKIGAAWRFNGIGTQEYELLTEELCKGMDQNIKYSCHSSSD